MSRSSGSSIRTRTIGRSPEIPWAHRPTGPHVLRSAPPRRPKRRVGVEDPAGESWNRWASSGIDPEMVQLHLCLRPGERDGALERRGVAILVGQRHGGSRGTGRRAWRRRGARSRPARGDPPSEAEDRIEHRARGVRQGPPVDHRHRRADARDPGRGSARGRSRTGRLPPDCALDHDDVGRPDRRVRRATGRGESPAGPRDRRPIRSGRRGWRRPDARYPPPAERARSRHRRSARSRASASPRFVTETRRSSASSSGETSTSSVVAMAPSRRYSSARSSEKVARYASGSTPVG